MKPPLALLGLAALLLAGPGTARLLGASSPPAGVDASAWRPAATGLEVSLRSTGGALLVLVRADPGQTTLRVVRAEPGAPLTAAALARRDGALVAVNGSFFDQRGEPIGWIVSAGKTLSPPAPKGWGAFVVSKGRARIVAMAQARGPADEALQAGPRLVIDGRPNPGLKNQVARRAFVGIDAKGRIVIGATGPTQLAAKDLAAFLARSESEGGLGLTSALNLDGGSSAQLYAQDAGREPIDLAGIPVPVLLEVLPKQR